MKKKLLYILFFAVAFVSKIHSQIPGTTGWVNTEYNTTEGNEFYVTTMKNGGATGEDYDNVKIYLYATARKATYICIRNDLANFYDTLHIPANGQRGLSIPVEYVYSDAAADITDPAIIIDETVTVTQAQNRTLHIYTCNSGGVIDKKQPPVSLYITNYHSSNGYEATNILPVNALEREYMVQTYHTDDNATEFAVIATQNYQQFNIEIKRTTYNNTHKPGNDTTKQIQFYLNKGQTRVIRTTGSRHSLTGTSICSNANFAVINGNQGTQIPRNSSPTSHVFEQTPSTDKWGKTYIVTPTNITAYKQRWDFVLLTAMIDHTVIKKDGKYLTELNKGETYTDTLKHTNTKYQVPYYESEETFLCYLYETGYGYSKNTPTNDEIEWGSPSMTTITPIEMGVKSIILAAFNASKKDLKLPADDEDYNPIIDHFINIVTKKEYSSSIVIDDQTITGFKPIDYNSDYYYVLHKIANPSIPHIVKCTNPRGTFTARLYGHVEKDDSRAAQSYSYSAGSRVNRSVDMLINNKYTKYEKICLNKRNTFTALVSYEYDNLEWFVNDSLISTNSFVENFVFDTTGIHDLHLVVHSLSPICENDLIDTVKAQIEVTALTHTSDYQSLCEGDSFTVQRHGKDITLLADTSTQYWNGQAFKFQFDVEKHFNDTIVTNNNEEDCDTVFKQTVVIHRKYNIVKDTTACDVFVWKHNKTIVHTFDIQPTDVLPVTKDHTHEFTSKHGCDSIVTYRVTLNKSYYFPEDTALCQAEPGGKFIWKGHESVEIPIDSAGIFTFYDSFQTKKAPYCDSTYAITLTIHPSYYYQQDTVLSNEDYIEWQNLYIRGEDASKKNESDIIVTHDTAIVISHQTTTYLCDSNYTLNIKYGTIFRDTTYDSVCENEHEYTWYRNSNVLAKISPLPTQDTTYIVTRKSPIGVDSIFYLNLAIHKIFIDSISREVCQNSGFAKWDVDKDSILDLSSGQWISAQEIPTIQNGTYEYHGTTTVGCDSIWRLFLHVINGYTIDTVVSMCENEIVVWQNKIFKGVHYSGSIDGSMPLIELSDTLNYMDSIIYPSAQGCDSTLRIMLNVHPSYINPVKIDTIDICDNQAYQFYDTIYNSNGEWKISDNSTHTYTLKHLGTSINGCDSAIMHIVHTHPTFANPTEHDTICESNLPYNYVDTRARRFQGLIRSGIYHDTLQTIHGCDSILTLQLTINPSNTNKVYVTWCQSAGPYSFSNNETTRLHNLTQSGIYIDTLRTQFNQFGCDSIIELHLTLLDSIITPIHVSICDNELPYNHPDSTAKKLLNLTKSGIYRDTLISVNGCDSVLLLNLQVNPTYQKTDTITICDSEGTPFIWRPTDRNGQREIPIPFSINSSINTSEKETVIVKDSSVLLESIYGCDSLVNLYLVIHPTYQFLQVDSICQDPNNKYWTWLDQQGGLHDSIDISKSGWITVGDTLKTIHECDSIFGIQLFVKPVYVFDSIYTICQNERIEWQGKTYAGNHYGWHYERTATDSIDIHQDRIHYQYEPGDIILESGTHYDTIAYTTSLGCDSIYCLKLIILPTNNSIQDVNICDNEEIYVFQTTDQYGDYNDTIFIKPITRMVDSVRKDTAFYMRERRLKTKNDCDSIVYLHLTVHPTYEYITHAKICERESYEWRGKKYYKTGVYYDSLHTQRGCDSTFILELYVKPVYYITRTIHACDNQVVMHADTLWYNKDSVRFTIDSTLLWKPGMIVPGEDEYREVHYRSEDDMCDSIIYRYQIFIHPTYNNNIPDTTICSNGTYKLHDHLFYQPDILYYEPGCAINPIDTFISDTLKTITCEKCEDQGCDSIYTAKIRILPAYKHVDKDTICSNDTYTWQNRLIQESIAGTYVYDTIFTTIHGCDSIYELQLTIDQSYDIISADTICADESYNFNGVNINVSGIYIDTLQTVLGCDSIIHLHLTVLDTTIVVTQDTICFSEKYHYFGQVYTQPGIYDTITQNEWGCKQYNYLHLEVIDTTAYTISIGDIICADDEEIIVEYERLSGKTLIEYSVLFDELGHAQGFEDIHHATLDTTQSYFSIPIPHGEVLPHPTPTYFDSQQGVNDYVYEDKHSYPVPNLYKFKIVMHNGICGDSLQRKDTTVNFWYPSWIHEQHWNDGIVLYNEIYNGGYKFSKYQWFLNGDSILGATKEYLYVPNQLEMNQRGECDNYYQLALTRLEDGYTTFTCPICPVLLYDTIVPQKDYFSVVPTIVSKDNPTIHILSTRPGSYKITNLMGHQNQDDFVPDANNYAGSIKLDEYLVSGITTQLIFVTLTLDTGDRRTIKVIIGN